MPVLKRKKANYSDTFTFRVSDVVQVPWRGTVLRLRVADGKPSMSDLGRGARLRVRSPNGAERVVTITDYAVSSGRATQERLDRVRELDVLISDDAAATEGPIGIGWIASGPVA